MPNINPEYNPVKVLNFEYATYRENVIEFILNKILIKPTSVLDPMAGTAPLIPFFERGGHTAYLYDILPLHYHINRMKLYTVCNHYREKGKIWFVKELLGYLHPLNKSRLKISHNWIDDSILEIYKKAWNSINRYEKNNQIFLKAILLLSLRSFSSFTMSHNPTWIKQGGITKDITIEEIIKQKIEIVENYYDWAYPSNRISKRGKCHIGIIDALNLSMKNKVDLIITSPPYCNRLDYINPYSPELTFLSSVGFMMKTDDVNIGSNDVKYYDTAELLSTIEWIKEFSGYTIGLLRRIESKQSKNEMWSGYYVRYYAKYFNNLFKVFENQLMNLSETGRMYINVQDNAYRGERIEIDRALKGLFKSHGYKTKIIKKWLVHHLGKRNTSKEYPIIYPMHYEKILEVSKGDN